jgi:hypothetical protein
MSASTHLAVRIVERVIGALALAAIVANFALVWNLPGEVLALLGLTVGVPVKRPSDSEDSK